MNFLRNGTFNERCHQGRQYFQKRFSDIAVPIGLTQRTINQSAVSVCQEKYTTPVCGKSLSENSGSCKECYTAHPVDVNRDQNGTMHTDTLNAGLEYKNIASPVLQQCREGEVINARLATGNLDLRSISYKRDQEGKICTDLLTAEMVDLRIEEGRERDSCLKDSGCVKGNSSWCEDTSSKWLAANDMLETALDIDMENLVVLENELINLDSTKKDFYHESFINSTSGTVKQDFSSSFLNGSLFNDVLASDFPAAYLGTCTNGMTDVRLHPSNGQVEYANDSRVLANETRPKEQQRTDEIRLLTEALRTRSFAPIAHLLSILTKDSSELMSGATLESYSTLAPDIRSQSDDDTSVASTLSNQTRCLSPQESYDSDHSSVLSDGRFGKRVSECDLSEVLSSGATRTDSGDQSLDFLTLENDGMEKNDLPPCNNSDSEVVKAIDDILTSNSACSLQMFQDLLDSDGKDKLLSDRQLTKVWKEASTETTQLIGAIEDWNYNEDQHINDDLIDSQADFNHLKMNKQPAQRVGPNRCYHLWDFLRELLENDCSNVVMWTDVSKNEFKLLDTKLLADLWGQKKKLPNMNYDKLSRSLRYYIKLDILRKVPGKRLHFQFGKGRMWKKMKK